MFINYQYLTFPDPRTIFASETVLIYFSESIDVLA
jgi:hypothetical protein